jgi:ribokinase
MLFIVMTFFNPAPANPNLNVEILRYVDIICTNETETELITEVTNLHSIENLRKAAQKLLDFGPKVAIITLGKNGVLIAEKNESGSDPIVNKIEASKVKVVDTTVSK